MSNVLFLLLIACSLILINCLEQPRSNRRRGRTLFHEDQDVLITMIIIFPYYFPLWERFYNTSVNLGTDAALAEFPNIPPGGLSPCGVNCRKRRTLEGKIQRRTGRFFQFDEQIVYFLIELIAAYPVPIIPNPYAAANRKPLRPKTGFSPLQGLTGLREVAGLLGNMFGNGGGNDASIGSLPSSFPQGIDNIGVQAPIGLFDRNLGRSRSLDSSSVSTDQDNIMSAHNPSASIAHYLSEQRDNNQTNKRNLCFSAIDFQSSRSIKENCFQNNKNSHILSAYETVTLDKKEGVSTLRLNWSTLISTIPCHFTEWYLKKVNFVARNILLGSIKTICSNTRLVLVFTVFQKYCKCLILKKLI